METQEWISSPVVARGRASAGALAPMIFTEYMDGPDGRPMAYRRCTEWVAVRSIELPDETDVDMGELGGSYESEQGPPEGFPPNQAALLAEREGISEEEAIIRLGGEVAPPVELEENEYRGYIEGIRAGQERLAQRCAVRGPAAPVDFSTAAPGLYTGGRSVPTPEQVADEAEDFSADLDDPYRM